MAKDEGWRFSWRVFLRWWRSAQCAATGAIIARSRQRKYPVLRKMFLIHAHSTHPVGSDLTKSVMKFIMLPSLRRKGFFNMNTQSLIQVRMDRPLRDDVAKLFESLGFDISTAVRMFFLRCRAEQGIPFPLTVASTTAKQPRLGISKGKWQFPEDWEKQDKEIDRQLEAD